MICFKKSGVLPMQYALGKCIVGKIKKEKTMRTKRFLYVWLALIVACALFLSACAPSADSSDPIVVVKNYYEALNTQNLDLAMSFIASDAVFINPTGTYEGTSAIRESLEGLGLDGITFELSNFRNTNGSVSYDYKVLQGDNLLDQGTNGLTIVENGKIVFDGTEDTLPSQ
jgi:hypothetical protein